MRILFISFFLISAVVINAQNPLIGDWVGKYSLEYDDETFDHFPLPYSLKFTEDSLFVSYFEEFQYANEEKEAFGYRLKKNILEIHEYEDTFEVFLLGVTLDTLAFFGMDFEEGIMVFSKVKSESAPVNAKLNLNGRSFVLKNNKEKVLDTMEFLPGSIFLSYRSPDDWYIDNYQTIQLGTSTFLNLRLDDYSFLKVLNVKKNEITLLNELKGSDTLTMTELIRKKKSSLIKTKWKISQPVLPCKNILVGINDSSMTVSADNKDVLSRYFLSHNEKFLLALPDDYDRLRNKIGMLESSKFNLYRIRTVGSTELHLYNQNRGIGHDPFICGKEFELRMVKTK